MLAAMEAHMARLCGALREREDEVLSLRRALAAEGEERRQAQAALERAVQQRPQDQQPPPQPKQEPASAGTSQRARKPVPMPKPAPGSYSSVLQVGPAPHQRKAAV